MTPMLTTDDKAKIRALLQQIDMIYTGAKQRSSGMVCCICGEGDKQAKHAVLKVKDAVHGYTHRQSVSPRLCHRHGVGWALSFNAFNPLTQRTDEEIDLHFALYVAKQLQKEK